MIRGNKYINLTLFAFIAISSVFLSWAISVKYMDDKAENVVPEFTEVKESVGYNYYITAVCFSDNCLDAKVADTSQKRNQGLMFVDKIPGNTGMLFVFDTEGAHSFWMKNVKIPLDIIWLSNQKQILYFQTAVPCVDSSNCTSYRYSGDSKYAIEVVGGFASENNLKVGDYVMIDTLPKVVK
ncbi:MAG: DUF192 domain-containing protein [Candidatus Woesearchaeota archaeon]|jgi:hypothetical protein